MVVSWINSPLKGAKTVRQPVEEGDTPFTFPLALFINYPSSGVDAKEEFMAKVKNVSTHFIQPENNPYPWETEPPIPRPEWNPASALMSSIHFKSSSGTAELEWTIEMKNGDIIRLRQTLIAEPYPVYRYHPEDTPMQTVADLQKLFDKIQSTKEENGKFASYEIYLPPITYEGNLSLGGKEFHLYGSTDKDGNRTTFTGNVKVLDSESNINYIENIDFRGKGDGIGVSASARLFLTDCQVSGWRTGVLSYGYSWVCLRKCMIEKNEIGFHFNSTGMNVTSQHYADNQFRDNRTAVLLESVPSDTALDFSGCVFSGNGADIDNRCQQPLEIANATFE